MIGLALFCCTVLAVSVNAVDHRIHTTGDVTWTLLEDESGEPQLAILGGLSPRDLAPQMRPDPAADIDLRANVSFILYTRENNATGGVRIYADDAASMTEFLASRGTKIMIHGFQGTIDSPVIQSTKNGWLDNGDDYNMIAVDWGVLCPPPFYTLAKNNSLLVGAYVAQLIDFLVSDMGASLADIHILGHSLGGQVVGIAGGNVASGKVARITGLDPALPLFDVEIDINRLDPTDAELVDVIHSDGGALGFLTPVGHVDFYPNGGVHPQPGCETDLTGQCSHIKCHQWYADSITNRDKYPAGLCDSFEQALDKNCSTTLTGMMGDAIGDTAHGIYYLAIGEDALPKKNSS